MICNICGGEIEKIKNKSAKYCIKCSAKRRNRYIPSSIYVAKEEKSLIDVYIQLEGRIRELEEKWDTVHKWAIAKFDREGKI